MNPQLVIEILGLVVSLLTNPKGDAIANTLVQIGQKVALAYAQQTGRPLDPSLIQVEAPV